MIRTLRFTVLDILARHDGARGGPDNADANICSDRILYEPVRFSQIF
jgi:hypothetical protein